MNTKEFIYKLCNPSSKTILTYEDSRLALHKYMPQEFVYGEPCEGENVNCEHVYPQSKFRGNDELRSDLHHLFPCISKINNCRENFKFDDIEGGELVYSLDFKRKIFEPENKSKGNIARACAYIHCAYPEHSEKILNVLSKELIVEWNDLDPISEHEKERNDHIERCQGNRNPFVD